MHSFIFHTRITAVSQALHDPDPWRAQERLHLLAQGGAAARASARAWRSSTRARARIVHSRTAVVIVSDGYDTGEPALLSAALAPCGGAPAASSGSIRCEPARLRTVSQGMQAALPHLDLLAPGADLASIQRVLPDLIEALR